MTDARVRPERPEDVDRIRQINDEAFGETSESAIVDGTRGTDRWIEGGSLVVEAPDGALVGHVLLSEGDLVGEDGSTRRIWMVGPVAVVPQHQREGVGGDLMRAAIDLATERGEPILCLLGHASYYPRFGFEPARPIGIEAPQPWRDANWMALRLPAWDPSVRGLARFPPAFPDSQSRPGFPRRLAEGGAAGSAMMLPMGHDALPPDLALETIAVHAGAEPDELTGAVSPPIYQTSTYRQAGIGRPIDGYDYARTKNPTRDRLERAVAALEGGGEGIAFASGSAATAAIADLAGADEEIVAGDDLYGGTYRYLERVRRPIGVATRYANLAGDPDALWEALSDRTRLVWFETPTNPLLKVIDIAAAARVVRDRFPDGPRPKIVVDNTFASPALQRPLDLGADIVFHSATKYLAGHSDTILGVAVTRDPEIAERLHFLQNAMGGVPGPFDCFLALRGLRTLHLRVERHASNAAAVAHFLAERDDVEWVSYPGLVDGPRAHPQGALAARQMRAGGGMVSFVPAPGTTARDGANRSPRRARERAVAICEATRLFTLAESLGGVESLIELPAEMTHASVAGSPLEVPEALIRLSVGIEGVDDLIADLAQALDRA